MLKYEDKVKKTRTESALKCTILLGVSILLVGVLLNFTSAYDFDNVASSVQLIKGESYTLDKQVIEYNPLWEKYAPVEIKNLYGLGETLAEVVLTEHTETCGNDCLSKFTIYISETSSPIDEIYFYRLDEGKRELVNIRNYNFQYIGNIKVFKEECSELTEEDISKGLKYYNKCILIPNGEHKGLINYDLKDKLPSGTYEFVLNGQKAQYMSIDWVIKTQGKILTSWATWGNISIGSQAEVILNSPTNNSIQYNSIIITNATANVTGGALLINSTLYDNSTGSWEARNTTNISDLEGIPILYSSYGTGGPMGVYGITFTTASGDFQKVKSFSGSNSPTTFLLKDAGDGLLASGQSNIYNYILQPSTVYKLMYSATTTNGELFTVGVNSSYISSVTPFSPTTSPSNLLHDMGLSFEKVYINLTKTFSNKYSLTTINWNYKFCDSDGACGFATANKTFSTVSFLENSQTYTTPVTFGSSQTFIINVSYDSASYSNIGASLVYNGTSYTGTKGGTGDIVNFTRSITIPTPLTNTNYTFYWNISLSNGTQYYFSSTTKNQTVQSVTVDNCSTNTNVLYNFTIVDEDTQVKINGVTKNSLGNINIQLYNLCS